MMRVGLRIWLAALAVAVSFGASNGVAQSPPIRHNSGQGVTPSFEGWFRNPDGTYTMSFGYMNRNYAERLDIPVGGNNRFEPGPPDRGQPTHFLPRRQTGVFTVRVPADFGGQSLTWILTAHGRTHAVPGHLRPEWQIDALKELTSGNTPPVLRFADSRGGAGGSGPAGTSTSLRAAAQLPVAIAVWVADDGVVKRRERERPRSEPILGVTWSKFRGPGTVTIDPEAPEIGSDGKAVTSARFSEPGDYVLRVMAWDSSGPLARGVMAVGFQCCWTNGYVHVSVGDGVVDR